MSKPKKDFKILQDRIKVEIRNKDLLRTAFVHKSYMNEHRNEDIEDNERLEFLGDAVLELAVTKHLYEKHPNQAEGEMTAFRSALVKGKQLAEVGKDLNLGAYLHLSKGEDKSGGRDKNYIIANTLEALIGAIYLDHDYDTAEGFIQRFILEKLDEIIEKGLHIDSKSQFQEEAQDKLATTPHYEVLNEEGPDHEKVFTMAAYIGEEKVAEGTGPSKQKAEEAAAENALKAKGWE